MASRYAHACLASRYGTPLRHACMTSLYDTLERICSSNLCVAGSLCLAVSPEQACLAVPPEQACLAVSPELTPPPSPPLFPPHARRPGRARCVHCECAWHALIHTASLLPPPFSRPTRAGLDARAASIVMRTVRNVGNSGRAVVVTIHQPSIEIFEAFDNLLLLQRGGRTTYFGPLGYESAKLVGYLQVWGWGRCGEEVRVPLTSHIERAVPAASPRRQAPTPRRGCRRPCAERAPPNP
eukprot:366315-Chlamydomonas_euryale.AAC.3